MKYLFSNRNRIEKILSGKFIYLFLDYDGTLAPIAKTPGMAKMPRQVKYLLRQLSSRADFKIAIVSGRALNDISKRVGLKTIAYVGNHGFEIKCGKARFISLIKPRYSTALRRIKNELVKKLSGIKGVLIEDKGASLSVHYRLADKKNVQNIKDISYAVTAPHETQNNVKAGAGKMVLEIKPRMDWDKGRAVLWMLSRKELTSEKKEILAVYVGDDLTDEDAFKALKKDGMTISIGKLRKSAAHYYLRDTKEVINFLEFLSGIKADI